MTPAELKLTCYKIVLMIYGALVGGSLPLDLKQIDCEIFAVCIQIKLTIKNQLRTFQLHNFIYTYLQIMQLF